MKMSKTQFKQLMKECLVELINEGAFDKKLEKIAEGKMTTSFNKTYNSCFFNENSKKENLSKINPTLLETIKNVTVAQPPERKSLFEEIMLDTALNTLQKQLAEDVFMGMGSKNFVAPDSLSNEVKAQDEAQLLKLSGGDISRWAIAAFGNKKK